jgi:hypothetical protein
MLVPARCCVSLFAACQCRASTHVPTTCSLVRLRLRLRLRRAGPEYRWTLSRSLEQVHASDTNILTQALVSEKAILNSLNMHTSSGEYPHLIQETRFLLMFLSSFWAEIINDHVAGFYELLRRSYWPPIYIFGVWIISTTGGSTIDNAVENVAYAWQRFCSFLKWSKVVFGLSLKQSTERKEHADFVALAVAR